MLGPHLDAVAKPLDFDPESVTPQLHAVPYLLVYDLRSADRDDLRVITDSDTDVWVNRRTVLCEPLG
ncbi:MAG: hypothetical protein ACREL7_00895 [Longimicrobiales bacterium]